MLSTLYEIYKLAKSNQKQGENGKIILTENNFEIMAIIKRTSAMPHDAEYAKLGTNGQFIEQFYRINECGQPQYWGEQRGWHASFVYSVEDIIDNPQKFLRII